MPESSAQKICRFKTRSLSREIAYYLRHVRPSVRMYQRGYQQTESVKFVTRDFYEDVQRKFKFFLKIGQNYRTLYMKTSIGFIVAGEIKSP